MGSPERTPGLLLHGQPSVVPVLCDRLSETAGDWKITLTAQVQIGASEIERVGAKLETSARVRMFEGVTR